MQRKVIFKDTETGQELILPVTPAAIEAETGVSVEIVNITGLGDVALPGYGSLSSPTLDCLFPARHYPFCCATPMNPYTYVEKFRSWAESGRVLRYIWGGTQINIPVVIEGISYRESDGTNDVYATVRMREYRYFGSKLVNGGSDSPRPPEGGTAAEQSYTVVWGDTLGALCLKFYGDRNLYPQLAQYNSLPNPDLIHPGQLLKIPPRSVLDALLTGGGGYPSAKYKKYSPPKKVLDSYWKKVLTVKERQLGG